MEVESMPDTELCANSKDIQAYRHSAKFRAKVRREYRKFITAELHYREARLKHRNAPNHKGNSTDAKSNKNQNQNNQQSQGNKNGKNQNGQNQQEKNPDKGGFFHRLRNRVTNFFAASGHHLTHPSQRAQQVLYVFLIALIIIAAAYGILRLFRSENGSEPLQRLGIEPNVSPPEHGQHAPYQEPDANTYDRAAKANGSTPNEFHPAGAKDSPVVASQENTTGRLKKIRQRFKLTIAQVRIKLASRRNHTDITITDLAPEPTEIIVEATPSQPAPQAQVEHRFTRNDRSRKKKKGNLQKAS